MKTGGMFLCTAALVLCGTVGAANAQTWKGAYIGGTIGGGIQPEGTDRIVRFDKTLDGSFTDIVTTAAGANAFSPGFCSGAAVNALPASGCTKDETAPDFAVRGGYDWQMQRFVVGAVGELSWANHVDSVSAFSTTPAFYTLSRELDWLGSVRGRAGVSVGRYLMYGTAGLATAGIEHSFFTSNVVNTFVPTNNDNVWGYQAGAGLDLRVGGRWSLGTEFLMTSLDDKDEYTVRARGPAPATNPFILSNTAGTDLRRADQFRFHSLRVSAGYRF